MASISRLGKKLADARLDANLITFYGIVVGLVLVSLLVRKLLNRGGNRLKCWRVVRTAHGRRGSGSPRPAAAILADRRAAS